MEARWKVALKNLSANDTERAFKQLVYPEEKSSPVLPPVVIQPVQKVASSHSYKLKQAIVHFLWSFDLLDPTVLTVSIGHCFSLVLIVLISWNLF